jgi:hypothetical protein
LLPAHTDGVHTGVLIASFLALFSTTALADECPPPGHTLEQLQRLKNDSFEVSDHKARQILALALTACLADRRPELRDGIAFEALSRWMRADALDPATRRRLRDRLLQMLTESDTSGFAAPFAALVLSEIARTDRIKPWLASDERDNLVDAAAGFLSSVRDYRGFSDTEGWRHGVAHGADFALQLVLNRAVTKPHVAKLLSAVASQVAPSGTTAFHSGEPERLARPVLFAAERGVFTDAEWQGWFERVTAPAPLASWDQSFASEAGLAKRHNTLAFLATLYYAASESENPHLRLLLPRVREAIRTLR